MAAGSDLLDEVFFNTEVDEKVVSDLVGSLESQLAGSGHGNSESRGPVVGNHIVSAGAGNANVQESKMGLAQDLAKAGAGVQGGVINNTRSQGSALLDATTGITSSAGSETSPGHSHGKSVVVSAMTTPVPDHGAGSGKTGTHAVQTLNGSNVTMNSHSSGSPAAASTVCNSSGSAPAVTVVNNGPGSVVKGNVNTVLPATSNTVIQSSFFNAQSATSTVITSQTTSLGTGPTVTLVRPPMHTAGPGTMLNGNNTVLSSTVNAANLPATVGSGISLQTSLLNSNPSPASVCASISTHVIKSESPKTIIQTTPQAMAPSVVANAGNLSLGQPMHSGLQTVPPQQPSTPAGIGKGPVVQNVPRTSTPTAVAANPGAIRAIVPQVLAPRMAQTPPNQPNIQNIQLPPGMVLVRSDSGQLLMIHQQTLAQMQAQSQSQNAMAPRPATPTSTPPVQLQAPGTPMIARQVTPTTIIKQTSAAQTTVQATTTLQRPPVVQPQIVLGGASTTASIGAASPVQPGTPQRTVPGATGATATETLENVKKCKNFLSTLIKLASSGKQSSETAANVKELVQNLLEGKIEAEDFTSRLYRELNSSPQPYLVPFLKRSLPALRQLTPDSAAFIQQSQLQQPSSQTSTALTAVVLGSSVQRSAGKATATLTSTLQPGHTKPGQLTPLVLPSQQQGTMVRPSQVTLTQTPMVTLRPPHNRIMLSTPQHVQLKPLQTVPVMKHTVLPGNKGLPPGFAQASAAQRNKLKEAGGGSFRDDDDINDVASMAGVNLSEESARILATNSELVGTLTRSCKDEAFLSTASLHRRLLEIGKQYGIIELGPDIVNIVSHATQLRLQSLIEKVTEIAQQRNITYKGCVSVLCLQEDERYEQISDVRSQLKFFEQLDQIERQRKEEQEREILMKAAKSRSRQEDPEQLRLKQKAKEMQQQELAQIRQRDANLTALAAIGPRKKRKVGSPGPGAGAEGSGSSGSLSGSPSVATARQFTRQRITRVSLRDLLHCLENESETSHSHLLYQAFLK
ncbi:transcription initiation factor TFIID subunit 4-like isoform X1 [Acipenser ruthenus]|uniref:transcription initiation factor TFIID subunit 4-like isoform X1 n=1 Tax=Acipenser ruthenus TaxID=7906 RepID=UPI00145BC780|nr:transcription initiation factor TFIID subunit 4-like isoform X1 [Acipenser ruthenus]